MGHHAVAQPIAQRGFTLLEVLLGLGIFSLVIGSVYSGYNAVVDIVTNTQYSSAAVSVIESRVEMVRNMRYQDVGVVGAVPAGILAATESVTLGDQTFTLTTTVRNIDNPFDGTVDGNPLDLNPADYKLVQFDMDCETCTQTGTLSMVTYVAPKTLEDESRNGSLEVTVVDASGQPIQGADVHIVNAAASIDFTDTTDNAGKLLILSMATGSAAYEITVSKDDYSTDRTYPPDNPANALKPHATVATQQLTLQTFVIDRTSTLNISARDRFCAASGPFTFNLTGAKLIGVLPDVYKYNEELSLNASGVLSLPGLEWDAYTAAPTEPDLVLVGMSQPLTVTLDPNTTEALTWVSAPYTSPTSLITVTDLMGTQLNGATVAVTGSGYSATQTSGRWTLTDTDWSNNRYTDISAGLNVATSGSITLEEVGGFYATGSAETLTSLTFDLGTSDASLHSIIWNPSFQPSNTSVKFHIAANNDNTTWEYVGPDGTGSSFFESSGSATPSGLNGKRYIRYRAYLETTDENDTPSVEDVSIAFSSACLQIGHATFDGLTAGTTYTVNVSASGYQAGSTSFVGPASWTSITIPLAPQ